MAQKSCKTLRGPGRALPKRGAATLMSETLRVQIGRSHNQRHTTPSRGTPCQEQRQQAKAIDNRATASQLKAAAPQPLFPLFSPVACQKCTSASFRRHNSRYSGVKPQLGRLPSLHTLQRQLRSVFPCSSRRPRARSTCDRLRQSVRGQATCRRVQKRRATQTCGNEHTHTAASKGFTRPARVSVRSTTLLLTTARYGGTPTDWRTPFLSPYQTPDPFPRVPNALSKEFM